MKDRFGIGWRKELAAAVHAHLDRIDLVEVIADDWLTASKRDAEALRTLAAQVPVSLHGVSLGMASAAPVDPRRLAKLAHLIAALHPTHWSEHLAFVRGGGIEIGHLAAPPRNRATISGAVRNLEHAARAAGSLPVVENVATLVDPPGSTMDEAGWIAAILEASGAELLLDLHNLFANATNFGFDPRAFLDRVPMDSVRSVHLARGSWIEGFGACRLLDDHLHAVPDPVFDLLAEVGARTARPLDVIVDRDGCFPPTEIMLAELDRARVALASRRRSIQEIASRQIASLQIAS